MFSTEHQKLSRPLEKRLATPRLKTTVLESPEAGHNTCLTAALCIKNYKFLFPKVANCISAN